MYGMPNFLLHLNEFISLFPDSLNDKEDEAMNGGALDFDSLLRQARAGISGKWKKPWREEQQTEENDKPLSTANQTIDT